MVAVIRVAILRRQPVFDKPLIGQKDTPQVHDANHFEYCSSSLNIDAYVVFLNITLSYNYSLS